MTPLNWQDSSRNAHRTRSRATPVAAAIPSSQSFQIQWMVVSFALIGIIGGFFLHGFTLPSQAASPSPSAVAGGNIIRPPDPNAAPQGGGCGGGTKAGGGCGGGAQGGGCGAGGGCGGGGTTGGGGCGAVQPARS